MWSLYEGRSMYDQETVWTFDSPGRVSFGPGVAAELGDELASMGASSALFVSDSGVIDAGIVSSLTDTLSDSIDFTVAEPVDPEPDMDVFRRRLEAARSAPPDVVVGVGGGSAMDVAKTVGALVESDGDPLDFVAPPTGEGKPVPETGRPTIGVPTTAGTGAETSPVVVISLPEQHTKVGISSPELCPDLALLDPKLTVTLPPTQTASSGMDALAQAIEAFTVRRYDQKPRADGPDDRPEYGGRTTVTDALARQAIEHVAENIRPAYGNGQNLDARGRMLLGSHLAGLAYTNAGVTVNHAMAMAIGGELDTPHGVTVAMLLPASLRYNAPVAPQRHARVAEALGADLDGLGRIERAEAAADAVERLLEDLDLPGGLAELGASADDVSRLVEKTLALERLTACNPREVTRDDVEWMIEQSL